ncbi:MAG: hypothetical protein V8R82_07450 [Clostridia bacterium]
MGVKINMSGINVSGDAKVLNDAKFSDKSRVDVEVEKSSINGNAEVLNGLNAGKQSEVDVKIKNTDIDGNARAFNNIDVQDGKVEVEVENLRLGKDVEFMNDKKIQENKEIKEEEKNETATHINGANNKTEISDDKEKIENETEFVQTENYLITEFGNEIKGLKAQKENINVMNENNEKLLKEIKAKEEEMKQIQDSKSVFYQDIYQEYKEKDDKFKVLISKRMSAERMLEKNIEKIKQEKIAKLKEELKSVEENRKSEFVNINSKEAEKLRSEKKELQEQIKLNDITKVEFENMPYEEQGKVRKAKEQILNNKHKLQEIDSKLKIVDLYKGKKPLERYKEINNEIDTINREFTLENLDNLIGKWEAKENKEKLEQTNSIRADLDARTEKAIENSKKRIFEEKSENVSEVETKNYFNGIDKIKKSSIIGIEIKEGSNIINITTKNENGEKQTSKIEKKIEKILKNKKTIFAEPEIVEILNNVEPSKFKQFLLKRKLNPVILATLNDNKQSTTILDYVEAIKNKENCENLKIKHDIRHSVLKGNLKRTMKRIAKTENKIDGMEVLGLKESKIAGLLGKKKIKNKPVTIKENLKLAGRMKTLEKARTISKKAFTKTIRVNNAIREGLKRVTEVYRENEDLEKLEDKEDPALEETEPKEIENEERR